MCFLTTVSEMIELDCPKCLFCRVSGCDGTWTRHRKGKYEELLSTPGTFCSSLESWNHQSPVWEPPKQPLSHVILKSDFLSSFFISCIFLNGLIVLFTDLSWALLTTTSSISACMTFGCDPVICPQWGWITQWRKQQQKGIYSLSLQVALAWFLQTKAL